MQVFSKGVGKFQIHEHYIGETPLSQFGDIEVRVYQPGQVVDHFHHIVWTSKEVGSSDGQGGLKLDGVTSDWVAETSSNEARFRGKVVELWSNYSIHTGNGDYTSTLRRDKWPWDAGQHVVITSTTQESLYFEGNIHFHDMGDDGDVIDPEELPDEIENPLGWGTLALNAPMVRKRERHHPGPYIVTAFRPGNRIRVKTDGGSEVTSFEPMSNVYVRIFEAVGNDGTYVCKDNNGTLALVASDTLEEVVGWSGFSSIDSPTADISVLERDREAACTGDFLGVPSNATALDVGLDFIFPRGLGTMNKNGDINARTCEWQVRVRPEGTNQAYQSNKLILTIGPNTPQRITVWWTEEMGLAPGRVDVSSRRSGTLPISTKVCDEVLCFGMQ
ncbi:hypothetical protein [Vibrio alginolyticus]|uniref:hypothetical protein n=1 Tax=Vibrio alginolyticus TaxID=663 RepID=UPI003B67E25E